MNSPHTQALVHDVQRTLHNMMLRGCNNATVDFQDEHIFVKPDEDAHHIATVTYPIHDDASPMEAFARIIRHPLPEAISVVATIKSAYDDSAVEHRLPSIRSDLPALKLDQHCVSITAVADHHLPAFTILRPDGTSYTHSVLAHADNFTFGYAATLEPGTPVHHQQICFVVQSTGDQPVDIGQDLNGCIYANAFIMYATYIKQFNIDTGNPVWMPAKTREFMRRVKLFMTSRQQSTDIDAYADSLPQPPPTAYYQAQPGETYRTFISSDNCVELNAEEPHRAMIRHAVERTPELDLIFVRNDDLTVPKMTLSGTSIQELDGSTTKYSAHVPPAGTAHTPRIEQTRADRVAAITLHLVITHPETGARRTLDVASDHYVDVYHDKFLLLANAETKLDDAALLHSAMTIRHSLVDAPQYPNTYTNPYEWAATLATQSLITNPEHAIAETLQHVADSAAALPFSDLHLEPKRRIEATSANGSITVILNP